MINGLEIKKSLYVIYEELIPCNMTHLMVRFLTVFHFILLHLTFSGHDCNRAAQMEQIASPSHGAFNVTPYCTLSILLLRYT